VVPGADRTALQAWTDLNERGASTQPTGNARVIHPPQWFARGWRGPSGGGDLDWWRFSRGSWVDRDVDLHPGFAVAGDRAVGEVGTGLGHSPDRIEVAAGEPALVADRAAARELTNVTTVAPPQHEPGLPEPVDLAIIVDAFHHLPDPLGARPPRRGIAAGQCSPAPYRGQGLGSRAVPGAAGCRCRRSLRLSANSRSASGGGGPAHVTMTPAGVDSVRSRQGESTEESPTCTTSGWR
jgi:hypothetical protein